MNGIIIPHSLSRWKSARTHFPLDLVQQIQVECFFNIEGFVVLFKFLSMFLVITLNISANANYKVSLVGAEQIDGNFDNYGHFESRLPSEFTHGINENGMVFGNVYIDSNKLLYICDPKHGASLVLNDPYCMGIEKALMNKNDDILYHSFVWDRTSDQFIWDTRKLNIMDLNSQIREVDVFGHAAFATGFNDSNQVIGYYIRHNTKFGYHYHRVPFFWENGVATDMGQGSSFAQNFENLGYYPLEIFLSSINNRGEIAGYFSFGKYNKILERYITIGRKAFFWNGTMHTVPLPQEPSFEDYNVKITLNNNGTILIINKEKSFLWNLNFRSEAIIFDDFYPIDLNDQDIVLGALDQNGCIPAIWNQGSYTKISDLLGVQDLDSLAPPFSNDCEVEKIKNVCAINNKQQIVALGLMWGKWYPCVIEPEGLQYSKKY